MTCHQCGTKNICKPSEEAEYCPICGNNIYKQMLKEEEAAVDKEVKELTNKE